MTDSKDAFIRQQLKLYEEALQEALSIEEDIIWNKLYTDRLQSLAEITLYIEENNSAKLTTLLESEGRSYGWSFYPNEHGEKAEGAFWKLKNLLVDKKTNS